MLPGTFLLKKKIIKSIHCILRFISNTEPTFNQQEQALQYTNRLYMAKRGSAKNVSVHSKKILVQILKFPPTVVLAYFNLSERIKRA